MQNDPYIMLPGKNLKMHLFHNVTFLYYHNRAITVVANTMGSKKKKKHLRRVMKLEIFLKGEIWNISKIIAASGDGESGRDVSPPASPSGRPSSGL